MKGFPAPYRKQILTATRYAIGKFSDSKKRFVRLVISRAMQNATLGAVLAFQYRPKCSLTHASGVSGEAFVSPSEGTA
jgi:hypothetical protein